MTNVLIVVAVGLIVGMAAGYIYVKRKKGATCIGCPSGGNCSGNCSSCNCKKKGPAPRKECRFCIIRNLPAWG